MIPVANPNVGSIPTIPTRTRLKRETHTRSFVFISNLNQVFDLNKSEATSVTTLEAKRRCECFDLHKKLVPYVEAGSWQKSIVEERKALAQRNEDHSDTLIILQHHPVYTLGSGSTEDHLNFELKDAPFDVYRTERGGEVTYHGPGQLVMYPIINLRCHKMDLHWYLRTLEEVVIRVLSSTFSIKASRLEGLTGVWVGDEKLAAVGIRVSQWIAYHGLALNVTTDLTPFQWIVPCGIQDRQVGSIKGLLGESLSSDGHGTLDICHGDDNLLIDITHKSLVKEFCEVFQVDLCQKPIPMLELLERERSASLTGS